jgi:hypothetical protein
MANGGHSPSEPCTQGQDLTLELVLNPRVCSRFFLRETEIPAGNKDRTARAIYDILDMNAGGGAF